MSKVSEWVNACRSRPELSLNGKYEVEIDEAGRLVIKQGGFHALCISQKGDILKLAYFILDAYLDKDKASDFNFIFEKEEDK